jgi:hypothetical protein
VAMSDCAAAAESSPTSGTTLDRTAMNGALSGRGSAIRETVAGPRAEANAAVIAGARPG